MSASAPVDFEALRAARRSRDRAVAVARAAEHQQQRTERTALAARRRQAVFTAEQQLAAQAATDRAHDAQRLAEREVQQAYAAVLDQLDPDDPLTALPATLPIVLFPVRLEARIVTDGTVRELRVRVFPEPLHIDTHEEELTDEELRWGLAFLERTAGATGEADRATAWAELAGRFGASRAAWIARVVGMSPEPPTRATSWTRPPHTEILPDRWLIIGHRSAGVEEFRVLGNPIPPRLAAGWDPQATEPDDNASEVLTDEGMRWLVDFEEAERVGMAVRVDLTDYPAAALRDIVAVGVKVSAGDASDLLERQLEALRYTTTLGFVPQGTPTNNTEMVTTGYSTSDPRHQRHFTLERLRGEAPEGSNAARVADALGAGRAAFSHAWGGHDDDQHGVRAMNRVLWPATFGYFLDHMVFSTIIRPAGVSETAWRQAWSEGRTAAYALFRDHVRARGPLPAVRVGSQPYGLLPIGDVDRWQVLDPAEAGDHRVRDLLLRVRERYFRSFNPTSPKRIGAGSNPERTLVDILAQSPIPMSFGLQLVFSDVALDILGELYRTWDINPILDQTWGRLTGLLTDLGASLGSAADRPARPFLGRAVYANDSHYFVSPGEAEHQRPLPAVQGEALSATEPLVVNYLDDIRTSTLVALRDSVPAGAQQTLLYHLVRHAKLSAYLRAIEREQDPGRLSYREVAAMAIPATEETCWDRGALGYPQTSRTYLEQYDHRSETGAHTDPELIDFDSGLDILRDLPSERLDLLFRETLALTDTRLDAWQTAFATKRLTTLRGAGHRGSYLGGYGWLLNVRVPSIEDASRVGDGTEETFDPTPDTVGYVHAPSVDHAKAAALLRSGHQARAAEGPENPFAIDLSSERVRMARYLLDGVREGQPLGALLGYRFERQLQESGLAQHIPTFRATYPLVAGKQREETVPAETLAAPSVVDGVALVRALRRHAGGPAQPHWMPLDALPTDPVVLAALQQVGDEVERLLDAVDDAVLTESVFQQLRGNPVRAGAALDALAGGGAPPPELESQQTPYHCRTVSHRLFVLLQATGRTSQRPRARAAPWLHAFSTAVLGDPGRYVVEGVYRGPDGNQLATRRIGLDALDLDPLDLVYLAAAEPGEQSDLAALLHDHLRDKRPRGVGPDAVVELRWEPDDLAAGQADWATLMELARAVYRLVAGSRPLTDDDLLDVGETVVASTADVADLRNRADAAVAAFTQAAAALSAALSAAQLRAALYAVAAFGTPGSIPQAPEDAPDAVPVLVAQGGVVTEVLSKRLAELDTLTGPGPDADPAGETAYHRRRLQLVFGTAFQVLVPFVPTRAAEVAAGFDAADTLLGGVADAAEEFLSQAAAVRPATAALQRLRDYAEVLDPASALPLAAAQLPFAGPQTRWGALPGVPTGNGSVALLATSTTPYDPTRPLAGLLVDAWEELVPAGTLTTGLALNLDAPNSEPPNVILLAAPADPDGHWSTDELLGAIDEVIRGIPARASEHGLAPFGQFLPAAFFAYNPENHTVSTDFSTHLR